MKALIAALLASSLVFIQCYVSGTRMVYALPAYIIIGLAGVLALFTKRDRSRLSWMAFSSTLLAFGYLLWRGWTSPVEYLARTDFYSALACLVVYALTSTVITSRFVRGGVIGVIFALAVVEVMFGGYQFAGGTEWLPFHFQHPGAVFRARGTFISSIHFAGFLEAVAPFALAFAFWGSRAAWLRWMCAIIAALGYFAVALSGSRGAWISSIFSLMVFVVLSLIAARKVQTDRFPAILYITIVALFATPFLAYYWMQQSYGIRTRLELLGELGEKPIETYDIRIVNWQAALDQWNLNPVWGTGAGTHLYYGREFRRPLLQPDPIHAHSDYLELLAEYGIIGASLMGLLVLCHFGSGFRGMLLASRHRVHDPYRSWPELAWTMGALSAAAAYFAHSAVDFNLHLPGNALWMAFVFGILANSGLRANVVPDSEGEAKKGRPFHGWITRFVAFGLGCALLWISLPKLAPEYWAEKSRVALQERKLDDAIAFADRSLASDPMNPFVHFQKGEAYRMKGDSEAFDRQDSWTRAVECYRASIALYERNVAAWIRLGRALDSLYRFEESRPAFRRAIELDPNQYLAWANYGAHLTRVGREAEAQEAFAKGQTYQYFDPKAFILGQNTAKPRPISPRGTTIP